LDTFENAVNAGYNSFQASVQKRLSSSPWFGSSYFTLAYTLGHSIDNAGGFRERTYKVPYYNRNQFRSDADFDVRHTLVFSGGWDLPLDHPASRLSKKLTQGWSLYPIVKDSCMHSWSGNVVFLDRLPPQISEQRISYGVV
jgi:hypothetical protein